MNELWTGWDGMEWNGPIGMGTDNRLAFGNTNTARACGTNERTNERRGRGPANTA